MPIFKYITFLLRDTWRSADRLKLLDDSMPILFLRGAMDEMIPEWHMHHMWHIATGKKDLSDHNGGARRFVTFPNGDHNNLCMESGYFEAIAEWMTVTETGWSALGSGNRLG